MRGKHIIRGLDVAVAGITPAGAGKTVSAAFFASATQDHPRRCGENRGTPFFAPPKRGSPPQVRGKQKAAALDYLPIGITPAGAGKTKSLFQEKAVCRDHPRRCGENHAAPRSPQQHRGSPPQVRGKPELYTAAQAPPRITPAGAGKTVTAYPAAFWR